MIWKQLSNSGKRLRLWRQRPRFESQHHHLSHSNLGWVASSWSLVFLVSLWWKWYKVEVDTNSLRSLLYSSSLALRSCSHNICWMSYYCICRQSSTISTKYNWNWSKETILWPVTFIIFARKIYLCIACSIRKKVEKFKVN